MEALDAWVHQQHFDKWSDQYFDTQENRINNALVTQLITQITTNNIRQQQQERTTNAVNHLLNGNFRVRRVAQALPDVFTARVTIPAIFRRVLAELIDSCFIMLAKIIFLLIVYSDSIATIFSPSAEVVENIIGDLTSTFLLQTTFIDEVYYDDIAQMDFSVGEDLLSSWLTLLNFKMMVIFYETYCTYQWEATLGKLICGMKIVHVKSHSHLQWEPDNRHVKILECKKLGLKGAFCRSLFKNLSALLMIPGHMTPLFNKMRRAIYDSAACTIVVRNLQRV